MNRSSGKQGKLGMLGKLVLRLKLGLIGFVLSNVRCSLFVVHWDKALLLLYLWSFCPF